MSSVKKEGQINFAVPSAGFIFGEDVNQYVLCKPKLMPLRSMTMEKLEKMQKDAEDKMRTDMLVKAATKENQ